MEELALIPKPDVLPLPAPVWLLEFLLLLTFFLHVVPMNLLLGGGIVAAVSHVRGQRDPAQARLARRLSELMPGVVAFTVTLGVAPLLFVQALYGNLLYTSSILIARAWILVIPLVIIGYYLIYWLRFGWEGLGQTRTAVAWLTAIFFAVVGFIYSNNFSLMLRPETWRAHYLEHPAGGHLNWSDPTLIPRYLHMLLGALAIAGLWVMFLGARGRSGDQDWSNWAVARGARTFTHATLGNLLIGIWFLLVLPRDVMLLFMGRGVLPTALLTLSIVAVVVALILAWGAGRAPDRRWRGYGAGFLALLVVALMVIIRHAVRDAMLAPGFSIDGLESAPQWRIFALFAVLLLAGIGAVAWLISVVLRAEPARH